MAMSLQEQLRAQRAATQNWIQQREAELSRGAAELEARGRAVYERAIRTGDNVVARTETELRRLGRAAERGRLPERLLTGGEPDRVVPVTRKASVQAPSKPNPSASPAVRKAGPAATAAPVQRPDSVVRVAPPRSATVPTIRSERGEDITELRRQQAEFARVRREEDLKNAWLPAGALAPVLVVAGLGAAGAVPALTAVSRVGGPPLLLQGVEKLRRSGETYWTRIGKRAHREFKERVERKEGWKSEPRLRGDDGSMKIPDARLPVRPGRQDKIVDLKPNTPSGARAGARALKKYRDLGRGRIVRCDPKDFR